MVLEARENTFNFLITAEFCCLSTVTYLVLVSEVLDNLLVSGQAGEGGEIRVAVVITRPQALVLGGGSDRAKRLPEAGAGHGAGYKHPALGQAAQELPWSHHHPGTCGGCCWPCSASTLGRGLQGEPWVLGLAAE